MRKITNWLLWIIIVISTAGMLYYGTQKEGYHVDEMYSYGLANSEYLPFMHFGESGYDVKDWMLEYGAGESFADLFRNLWKDFQILKEYDFQFYNTPIYQDYLVAQANSADTRTTTWVPGQAYRDYLGVSESNTFNYASVYYNQRGDVHPPLYYMVLHTICSIFQGTFSKWYALSINIVALIVTMLVLCRMISRYAGGERVALAAVAVYGLSCGCFTTELYLRMYAMLTLWVVLFVSVHLKICDAGYTMEKRKAWALFGVTLAGYMTHYYFVLYAIGTAAVFVICMCIRKKWKPLFRYLLTLAFSAGVGLCIWPFAIRHVFSGYRGRESLNVLTTGEFYWIKTKLVLQQVVEQLYGGHWWILVVCLIVLAVGAGYYRKTDGALEKGFLVAIPALFYMGVVTQIVPFYADRYVMCTYPFLCLLPAVSVWILVRMVSELKKVQTLLSPEKTKVISSGILAAVSLLLVVVNNGFTNLPGYLAKGGQELITVPEQSHCVYVLTDGTWNESAQNSLMLSRCEEVAIVYRSDLPVLTGTYQYEEGDCVIVAVSSNLNAEEVCAEVKAALGIEQMQQVRREDSDNIQRIYLK